MEAQDIIASLHRSGAVLDIVDGELRCRAPKGVLTRELVEQLKVHKAQIERIVTHSNVRTPTSAGETTVESYPLTFAQRRLWFLERLIGPSPTYNTFGVFKVTGPLQVESLRRGLIKLVRRHAVLTVYFTERESEPVQVPRPGLSITVPLIDATSMNDVELTEFIRQEGRRPFDLARDCLIRMSVVRLDSTRHLLLLNMHHIVADGWSLAVFVRELAALYNADLSDEPAVLPVLTRQYFDYALEERTAQWEERVARHVEYWRERLARLPPALDLCGKQDRPAVQTYDGAFETFWLDASFARTLAQFRATRRVTAFSVLLAAFKVLLARYSGQRDIVVGTIAAHRNDAEVEKLMGFFANTLAIRCEVSSEQTFAQLVDDVQRANSEAHEHELAPFERVVQALGIERDLAVTPVFQVLFLMQNIPSQPATLGELSIEPVEHDNAVAKYDLTLSVTQLESGLRCGFQYRLDLFATAFIQQLIASYRAILQAALAHPETAVSRLPVVARAEHASVVRAVAREQESTECLHTLFEQRCASSPDSTALHWEGGSITYHELDLRANRVAHALLNLGVCAESRVGLCMQPAPDMVVGILAILKLGACYVPLDPAYPSQRLEFIASDAGVKIVLTEAVHVEMLSAALPETRLLDIATAQERSNASRPECHSNPQQAAYVIYTSGSTGRPKGVVVTHANVVRLLQTTARLFDFSARDVWTLFHSFAFDFSVWELWGAFANGAAVSIVPYATRHDPRAFLDWLKTHHVTVLSQTPTAFARLFGQIEQDSAAASLSLRYVVFGGESLNPRSGARWAQALAPLGTKLINMYGITETTVHVTFSEVSPSQPVSFDDIGRPLPDLEVYVLDESLQPLPLAARGEMYVAGPGLARGYLGRPDLTASRFVPNPFATQPGERMYRTGDGGRLRRDGRLEYLGRIDRQVNVRGFRIELGEIESCLRSHRDVRDAMVIETRDDSGEAQLTAYLVPAAGASLDAAEIYETLRSRLPSYMLPAQLRRIEHIPTTTNGKVDQAALLAMDAPVQARASYAAPRDATEAALVSLFQQTLNRDQVGVHDNVFALGGDSISCIRVIAEAHRRALPLELPDLFRYQTPAALSTVIRTRQIQRSTVVTRQFELVSEHDRARLPEHIEDAYPLTALQVGMLFHSEREPAREYYHNVSYLRLKGSIEPEPFRAAVRAAVARHPVLRTSVWRGGSEPLQLVHRDVELPVQFVDLSGVSEDERALAIDDMIERQRREKFDFERAPLFKLLVHRIAADECCLTWVEHHLILDGWSVATLFAEIFEDYFSLRAGTQRARPALQTCFRDYIAAERLAVESPASEEFWREQLAELKQAPLPPMMGVEARLETGTGVAPRPIVIDRAVTESLRRLAINLGVPLKTVLLSVHIAVTAAITGSRDVVTGLVTNGRLETQDGEGVLGLFLNTLPFAARLSMGEARSWRALIRRTAATELDILPHRRFPMPQIRALHGDATLFDTAFNYMNFHVLGRLRGRDDELQVIETRNFQRNSLALMANWRDDTDGDLTLTLSYDDARLSMQQIRRFGEYYVRALATLAANPESQLAALDLLTPSEHRLIRSLNATRRPAPGCQLAHERIELHASQAPMQTALLLGDERLSYAELNARANRLAHRLMELAVPGDGLVGICLERSFELVIAFVAALKAGAAMVFMEPEQPLERLRSLVREARLHALIVDSAREAVGEGTGVPVLQAGDAGKSRNSDSKNPLRILHPSNLAYVVFTSGTTGRPKGAMNSHAALCNQIDWMQSVYRLQPDDVVLQKTPISFDVSVWELLWPICAGAQLALARPGGHRDPPYILHALRTHAVTVCHFVPSMLRLFLDALGSERLPSELRIVICSGEALSESVRRDFHAVAHERTELHNLYGPAEASIDSSYWACPRNSSEPTRIGKPVHNTQLYVVHANGQLAPFGTPGELYIGGEGLGRGYLHRPDLTAERFVPDPWSDEPGARLYRTGDRVRYSESGDLEYLGRLDNQVKIAGCRIEPEEVERTLASLPGVRAAAIIVRTTQAEQSHLVAYVVMERDVIFDDHDLHRALRAQLPGYMCPASIIAIDQLPVGANGKVDRRALQQLATATTVVRESRPPESETERCVARIWSAVLGGAPVDLDTNFFTGGGNSLRAMQVIAAIRNELAVEVPIAQLFESPVLYDFALATLRLRLLAAGSEEGFMEIASRESDARLEAIYQSGAGA